MSNLYIKLDTAMDIFAECSDGFDCNVNNHEDLLEYVRSELEPKCVFIEEKEKNNA